jgi:phosphoribosylglycinamide formyltransferase-1
LKLRVALFASGGGTNAMNLLKVSKDLHGLEIPLVVVDQISSPLPKLISENFPEVTVRTIPAPNVEDKLDRKIAHEKLIVQTLREAKIDWIFLAGYMRIIGQNLLNEYSGNGNTRIVNIHPSLLPAYPGLHAYERSFEANEPVGGVTIHLVDSRMDTGSVIVQEKFERKSDDTLDAYRERGKTLEWKLYADVLMRLSIDKNLYPKESTKE